MQYCAYYQAQINKKETWYFTATLKSFEHVAFDRTLNKEMGLFEFFVPEDQENIFIELIEYFVKQNIVHNVRKLSNRLQNSKSL